MTVRPDPLSTGVGIDSVGTWRPVGRLPLVTVRSVGVRSVGVLIRPVGTELLLTE